METAAIFYAHVLGIDIDREKDLLPIAEKAMRDLPKGWSVEISDENSEHPGVPYFHNSTTEESIWHHPREETFLALIKEKRAKMQNKSKSNDNKNSNASSGRDQGSNQNQSSTKPSRDKVTDTIEIEDFVDEYNEPENNRMTGNAMKSERRRSAGKASNEEVPKTGTTRAAGFGMSEADFQGPFNKVEKNLSGNTNAFSSSNSNSDARSGTSL
jgi:hypothetical protein